MLQQKRCVLVADDEARIVRALRDLLQANGFCVLSAGNGRETLQLFEQYASQIDLLLLDVMMPEQSGLTFYGAVCRDEDWKRIPVVMLSAVPISVREHAFATIGLTQGPLPAPAACLEKPCTPEALLEVVNRLVPEPTTA